MVIELPLEVQRFIDEYEPAPYAVDALALEELNQRIRLAQIEADRANELVHKLQAGRATICAHDRKTVNVSFDEGYNGSMPTIHYSVVCMNCGNQLFDHEEKA